MCAPKFVPNWEKGALMEIWLDDATLQSRVRYFPDFVETAQADEMFARLKHDSTWQRERPIMFGKPILVRRASCAFGESGLEYPYSGLVRNAEPWPEVLVPWLKPLQHLTQVRFNFVLCNLYEDGEVGLGWHADDEKALVLDAPIASISLGAVRDFSMRLGRRGKRLWSKPLHHGSLLVMDGQVQRHYQHALPPRKQVNHARINLTFRCVR